ncbi:hypothetical protein MKX03_018887, partial [Papaver bracteatum]
RIEPYSIPTAIRSNSLQESKSTSNRNLSVLKSSLGRLSMLERLSMSQASDSIVKETIPLI